MLNKNVALKFNPTVCFAASFYRKDVGRGGVMSGAGHWLASALKRHGLPFIFLKTAFYKGNIQNVREELETLKRRNVKIIGASLYNNNFEETLIALREIREALPDVWIVTGCPMVNGSDLGDLVELLPEVDCFMAGDCEYPFLKLANELLEANRHERLNKKARAAISRIDEGIHFRHLDFVHTRDGVNEISSRAFRGFELYWDIQELIEDIRENGGLHLNTRRGCKYECIFCSHQYREPVSWTSTRIIKELRKIKGLVEAGILPSEARNIFIDDDDFFQSPSRARNFLKLLSEDDELNNFFNFRMLGSLPSFLRNNGEVNLRLIESLSRVRSVEIGMGTDAFCDSELGYLGKSEYTYEQTQQVVAAFERYKIPNVHFVILTSNQTTVDTLVDNLDGMLTLLNTNPRHFRLSIQNNALVLHPGSILGRLTEEGRVVGEAIYHYRYKSVFYGYVLSEDEIVREFLRRITKDTFRFSDDIERLSEELRTTRIGSPEYFVNSFILNRVRELHESMGRDEYNMKDISNIEDHYINIFVIGKMFDILSEIIEGKRPDLKRA